MSWYWIVLLVVLVGGALYLSHLITYRMAYSRGLNSGYRVSSRQFATSVALGTRLSKVRIAELQLTATSPEDGLRAQIVRLLDQNRILREKATRLAFLYGEAARDLKFAKAQSPMEFLADLVVILMRTSFSLDSALRPR